jgi:DinB superfamily
VTRDDLRRLTNTLIERVRQLLRRCVDADVVFVPVDPRAYDPLADTGDVVHIGWTLAHIVVHMTASAEEAASLAAELARGVAYHGRSRSEVPWKSVTTIAQCRARLEESRRMRLASLGMWPDAPHLDTTFFPGGGAPARGPIECFLSGLRHDADHLEHLRDVIGQARTYRRQQTLLGRWRARFGKAGAAAPATAVER